MKSLASLLAVATALTAGAASAQSLDNPQLYGSLGYSHKDQSDLGSVQLRLGTRLSRYFGVEGELATGVKSDSYVSGLAPSFKITEELRWEANVYAVGYLPLSDKADLFAKVGYGRTGFKYSAPAGAAFAQRERDDESWSLGGGGQYFFDGKNGVRIDYQRQFYNSGPDKQDVWSVAYTRRF